MTAWKIGLRRQERLTGVNATLAWTALTLSIAAPALVALPVGALVKTLAVLAFACFGPGAALLCRVRLGIAPVTWAITLVLSMSLFALPAVVMVWAHLWHPFYAFAALAGGSIVAAGSALRPAMAPPPAPPSLESTFAAPARFRHVPAPRANQDHFMGTETMVFPRIQEDHPPPVATQPDAVARASAFAASLASIDGSSAPDVTAVIPRITDAGPMMLTDATAIIPVIRDDIPILPAGGDATQVFQRITDSTSTIVIHLPPGWDAERSEVAHEYLDRLTPVPRYDGAHRRATGPRPEAAVFAGASRIATAVRDVSGDPRALGQFALFAAAIACWVVSLRLSSIGDVHDYGLLQAMHPLFFVGVVLCVAGFVIEIGFGARRGWLLFANLAAILLMMHATVPILLHEPEYAWTYKHVGVIQLFRTTGHIVNSHDIYEAWPTFFATVAQLVTLSGANTIGVAAWGPLFFDLANCLPLYAIVRTLSSDRRLPYLTVFVFTCINWIAQDYLSPQAFVYVLCLGAILIMVRWLRGRPGPRNVRLRLLTRAWAFLHVGLKSVPYAGRRAERTALICLYFVYVTVVTAHQLSPYLIVISAGALVVLGLMRTWHVVPVLLALSILYLIPNYGVVNHYGLFDGIDIFKNFFHASQGTSPTTGVSSAGQIFSAEVVQLLSLLVWGLSAISVVMSRNRLGPVALPAVLAFAPFALLLGQSYGGEGIYRVYLFSAPWCAYLVCRLLLRVRQVPKIAGLVGASLLISAAALVGMQGEHGQLTFDQFTPDEVTATTYLYQHAPVGSTIVEAMSNLPDRLTARYVDVDDASDPESLQDVLPTDHVNITEDDMERVVAYCRSFQTPVFVVISTSEINYAHYFGYLPNGLIANLRQAMDASPFWEVTYRNADEVIYRFDA